MAIKNGFVFGRCPDGLIVVLEGVVDAEDASVWQQARARAIELQCDQSSLFVVPHHAAMAIRELRAVVENHTRWKMLLLEQSRQGDKEE